VLVCFDVHQHAAPVSISAENRLQMRMAGAHGKPIEPPQTLALRACVARREQRRDGSKQWDAPSRVIDC
jgi:hypothetical protein